MIIDGYSCRKPCKVGVQYLEDGTKVRVSIGLGTSGSIIPRPEILKIGTTPRHTVLLLLLAPNQESCSVTVSLLVLRMLIDAPLKLQC